jgi:hypothetical protein
LTDHHRKEYLEAIDLLRELAYMQLTVNDSKGVRSP